MILLIPAFFLMGASLFTRRLALGFVGSALFAMWLILVAAQVLGVWISHP